MKNILVIGATGPQGRPVAEKLAAAGFSVRAMVRDPAKAADLAALGVELVKGDLDDPASVAAATRGQDGVFMLISFFTGTFEQARTLIDASAASGVKKIVWNVAGKIQDRDTGNPAVDKWRPILGHLRESGLAFVALQPTVYMENFLIPAIAEEVGRDGVLAYPMPETVRCQWISHQDAAAYVVAAFRAPADETRLIEVCGPERLTGPEIAARFGAALGRSVTFRPMPPEEFAKAISFGGNEEAIVGHYRAIFEHPEMMTTNVDHGKSLEALPITPLSLEDWVRMYRGAFTGA